MEVCVFNSIACAGLFSKMVVPSVNLTNSMLAFWLLSILTTPATVSLLHLSQSDGGYFIVGFFFFVNLFILGCIGSSLLCTGFL